MTGSTDRTFSFEFFPPATPEGVAKLRATREQLARLEQHDDAAAEARVARGQEIEHCPLSGSRRGAGSAAGAAFRRRRQLLGGRAVRVDARPRDAAAVPLRSG